jgi:hypothetical protein
MLLCPSFLFPETEFNQKIGPISLCQMDLNKETTLSKNESIKLCIYVANCECPAGKYSKHLNR